MRTISSVWSACRPSPQLRAFMEALHQHPRCGCPCARRTWPWSAVLCTSSGLPEFLLEHKHFQLSLLLLFFQGILELVWRVCLLCDLLELLQQLFEVFLLLQHHLTTFCLNVSKAAISIVPIESFLHRCFVVCGIVVHLPCYPKLNHTLIDAFPVVVCILGILSSQKAGESSCKIQSCEWGSARWHSQRT